jgi:hypothetical protein
MCLQMISSENFPTLKVKLFSSNDPLPQMPEKLPRVMMLGHSFVRVRISLIGNKKQSLVSGVVKRSYLSVCWTVLPGNVAMSRRRSRFRLRG